MNNISLFDKVKELTNQATEQVKSNQLAEFQETAERVKDLMETGELPRLSARHQFEIEIDPELTDRVWKTLTFKSRNPTHFVSVIQECWLISDAGLSFERGAVKENIGKITETVLTDEKRLTVLFIETTEGRNFLVTNEVRNLEAKVFLKGVYVYDWPKPKVDFIREMKEMSDKIIGWAKKN